MTLGSLAVVAAAAGGFLAFAWRPAIEPVAPPAPASFAAADVARGAELAALGNCATCHTADGGAPFAGGRPFRTPFGTLHATNITPDADTGIGRWSEAAFVRAMREGVGRDGRHLYPAFPYDHFVHVTDEDNAALYAYLMTRPAVQARVPPNDLDFPYDRRMLIAAWKLLFFDRAPLAADPALDPAATRGRYLAEGLGHCGACHTPRNEFGAEDPARHYAGAEVDGWTAYALDASSPAAVPWTVDAMTQYLKTGSHPEHGVSRGPMAPVTANLAAVPEPDVRAIAAYVVAGMAGAKGAAVTAPAATEDTPVAAPSGDQMAAALPTTGATRGEAIYRAACAGCHESGRPLPYGGLHLSLSTGAHGPTAQNLVNVVLQGLPPAEGEASPQMPGFAGTMSPDDLAALVDYVRERFTDKPAWTDTRERARATIAGVTQPARNRSHGDAGDAPANVGEAEATW